MLRIREMMAEDCSKVSQAFAAQGWDKPMAQYEAYWEDSLAGKRVVLLAERQGQFAGYVTILWQSGYPPFQEAQYPEIADFNVLIAFRRQGIGTKLLDEAERRIARVSSRAGIGVGLYADYGAAQRLYVRRGYLADGRGLYKDGRWLKFGDTTVVDDDLTLFLTKELATTDS